MSIPITGILLIPLGALLVFLPWRYCLIGLMTMAMMSPAAVVNVGTFGLQPGFYLTLLLIARTIADVAIHGFALNSFVLSRLRLLFCFAALVFVVLFIALCFFQNGVDTLPGSFGFKSGLTHPFRLARENFTQIFYLTVNIWLCYAMGHNGARQDFGKLLKAWDVAFACGLAFAVAVCVWQFASLYGGVPFPSDFFYSNAGYSRADSQSMGSLYRINGPFEEPSTLGYTFTGYLLYAWGRYRDQPTGTTVAMIVASILCMLVSTSTTSFLGLFLFFCIATFDVLTKKTRLLPSKNELTSGYIVAVSLIAAAIIAFLIVVVANWAVIDVVLSKVLFNKTESTSFQQRYFADQLALQIFTQTYGIGVGLGSHKANSLALTLLSNTGILGVALLAAFAFGLLRWKPRRLAETSRYTVRPFQLGLIGLLVIHIFSNPNLGILTLWLAIGGLLALQAAERRQIPARPAVRAEWIRQRAPLST